MPTVTLVASVKEITYGQPETFTVVATGDSATLVKAVDLFDSETTLGGAQHLGVVTLSNVNGVMQGSLTTTQLVFGNNSVYALFGGGDFLPGTGAFAPVTVRNGPSSTSIQILAPEPSLGGFKVDPHAASTPVSAPQGQQIAIVAQVASEVGPGPVVGEVTFLDGATVLGTADSYHMLPIPTYIETNHLSIGTHTITAVFDYGKPTSLAYSQASATVTITPPLSATTSALSDNTTVGQPVTFIANIAGFDGAPTGSVSFLDGGAVLGTAPVSLVNGVAQATFATSQLAAGSHTITARYGDTGFDPAAAPIAITTVTVNPPLIAPGTAVNATGSALGSAPVVIVTDATTGAVLASFTPFDPNFTGGVAVAVGDVNGDGTPDVIAAAGTGGGPNVVVFSGVNGAQMYNFMAFDANFTGGVAVAVADVNGDGYADIIVGAGSGGGPNVSVFSGLDGARLSSFFAYDTHFTGGVRVSAGNVMGTGETDVICGAGPGGGPNVTVFRGTDGAMMASFFAYAPDLTLGITVSAGTVNGTDQQTILVTAGRGVAVTTFTFNLPATGMVNSSPDGQGESNDGDIEFTGADSALAVGTLDAFFASDPAHMGSLFVAGT